MKKLLLILVLVMPSVARAVTTVTVTGNDKIQVWAESAGPLRLMSLTASNYDSAARYLMLFAVDSPSNGDRPISTWALSNNIALNLNFSPDGYYVKSFSSGALKQGCTFWVSTTTTTLTKSTTTKTDFTAIKMAQTDAETLPVYSYLRLRDVIGSTMSSNVLAVTNLLTDDGGQLIITTTTNATAGIPILQLYNSSISDVIISNAAANVSGVITFGTPSAPGGPIYLEMHNVKIYGKDTAMIINCTGTEPLWTGYFYDSLFQGVGEGAEDWRGKAYWYNCLFVVTNGTDGAVPFVANDHTYNEFYSSQFWSDNTSGEDLGFISWTTTTNYLNDCVLGRRKAPTSNASALFSVLENNTVNVFKNCVFKPLGALAIEVANNATPYELRLENCIVDPPTNGVIFQLDDPATVISIRGGNLIPANFSAPSQVTWLGVIISSTNKNAAASTAITFPATTVNWTNTQGFNIALYIDNSGITGTLIKKNGQQVYSSLVNDATLLLKPGDYFSETYTVGTPSARWEPQ